MHVIDEPLSPDVEAANLAAREQEEEEEEHMVRRPNSRSPPRIPTNQTLTNEKSSSMT